MRMLERRDLQMGYLSEANLQAAVEIETASYPEDEAASPENMRFRQANAGAFFLEATLKESVSDGIENFGAKASVAFNGVSRELGRSRYSLSLLTWVLKGVCRQPNCMQL